MKMPADVTKKISARALDIAKRLAPKKTGLGAQSLEASSADGVIGIEIPPEVAYMRYQNDGTEPRIMNELAGKVIPIRNANGSISFRSATTANIGKKIVARDEKGGIISKVTWRHPGIKGTHFVEKALRQSVSEWAQTTNGQEVIRVLDQSDVQYLMNMLRGQD